VKKILVTLVLLLTLFVCSAVAQDATEEVTQTPAAEVTEQDVVIVVTPTPGADATEEVEDPDVIVVTPVDTDPVDPDEPWWAKYFSQFLIFGGLILGALKALNMWLKNRVNNPQFMQSTEYAYRAVAPDFVEEGFDRVMVGLAAELEELGGNASKFLRQLGTKGEVIAQKVDEVKQAKQG
jgi:hypothetical protein